MNRDLLAFHLEIKISQLLIRKLDPSLTSQYNCRKLFIIHGCYQEVGIYSLFRILINLLISTQQFDEIRRTP